jgi:hypothetical protein
MSAMDIRDAKERYVRKMSTMRVTDVSVGSCVDTGIIDVAVSGPRKLGRMGRMLTLTMDAKLAREMGNMLIDSADHMDAEGHGA